MSANGGTRAFRGVVRELRKRHDRDEAHRRLSDRAHALAMSVLQSPAYSEFKAEVDAVLEMMDVCGEPLALRPRPAHPSSRQERPTDG